MSDFGKILSTIEASPLVVPDQVSPVSIVIATFNRSPFQNEKSSYNPLSLCFDAILKQKKGSVHEVIVIDDASTDFTENLCEIYEKSFSRNGISFNYLKNSENQGVCKNRNKGILQSKSNNVLIIDDDCLISDQFVPWYSFLLDNLRDEKVAIVQPARYLQAHIPTGIVEDQEIGVFDIEKGLYKGNFDKIPESQARSILKRELDLQKPMPVLDVSEFSAVGMLDKTKFIKTGMYREFPPELGINNAFGLESEIALDLKNLGFRSVMCPDPRIHDTHLRFGSPKRMSHFGLLNEREQKCITYGLDFQNNSGVRCSNDKWCYYKIASYFYIFSKYSDKSSRQWKDSTWLNFVQKNEASFYSNGVLPIIEESSRVKIWQKAIGTVESYLARKFN